MSSRCACASKSLRLTVQGGANPNASCSKAVSRMVGPLSLRPSCSSLAPCSPPSIGIGGHLTMPPLPHHRAYGSVPRRFGGLSAHQGLHGEQSMILEAFVAEGAVHRARRAQPPRSLWAEDSRTGHLVRDPEAAEFLVAPAARLPLDPYDATQAPPCPAVQ